MGTFDDFLKRTMVGFIDLFIAVTRFFHGVLISCF